MHLPTLINLDDFFPEVSFSHINEALAYAEHQSVRMHMKDVVDKAQELALSYRDIDPEKTEARLSEVKAFIGDVRSEYEGCDDPVYTPVLEKCLADIERKLNAIVFGVIQVPEQYQKLGLALPAWFHKARATAEEGASATGWVKEAVDWYRNIA